MDGSNELTFEFSTNRKTEDSGFLYFIQCVDPEFDLNAVDSGLISSLQAHQDSGASCQQFQTQTSLYIPVSHVHAKFYFVFPISVNPHRWL